MADISKITLPSGNTYDIKDAVARQAISGGVAFIIAWDGTSTPVVANIPAGVTVRYNDTNYTGTLSPETDDEHAVTPSQAGAFYLVKSSTSPSSESLDIYDEYVSVGDPGSKTWEKIGDTKVNLTNVVTGVTLNKVTDKVIGSSSTFAITQPTISLATGATAGAGVVSVVTGISSSSASGDQVSALTGLGTPSTASVLTGVKVTTQPSVSLAENDTSGTGRITYISSGSNASTTKIKGTASGGAVSASGDSVTAITGLGTPTTQSAVSSVSPTTKKLSLGSVTGVSGSTTASKATGTTAQTTATGGATGTTSNTDWLRGISVSNETLTIGAATMTTQSTPQYTFSDVTVPVAASATTVATGGVTTTGSGADIVTGVTVGTTFDAVTGYTNPSTDTVLGTASSFSVTNPTITLSTGTTGDVDIVQSAIGGLTTKYLSASSSDVVVGASGTASAVTGYPNPTTDTVLGTESTLTVTPTTTNIKATASGANTAWDNKDEKSVLDETTSLTVTYAGS